MARKQAIIDTATRLFAQKGFAETSTAEIAEQAGVAHGTLFYHFKSKRGIIHEIFSMAGADYLRQLQSAIAAESTGMKKIEAILRFNEDYSRHNSQQIRIFQRFFPDLADDSDPERELIDSVHQQAIDMIAQSIAAGVADGTISCRKIDDTALIIHSLIFGITHMNLMMAGAYRPNLTQGAIDVCRKALGTVQPFESGKH